MARQGKIARLPREIREELNRRLDQCEPAIKLLPWLNGLPQVQAVLDAAFGGAAINHQNLTEWRKGGYAEWEARKVTLEQAGEVDATKNGRLTDHLANVLAARFGEILAEWHGGTTSPEFNRKLRVLGRLCEQVVRLRRGDQYGVRLTLAQEKEQRDQERTVEDVLAQFQSWAGLTEVQAMLERKRADDARQRRRHMQAVLNLQRDVPVDLDAPLPPEIEAEMRKNGVLPDDDDARPDEAESS